MRRLFCTLTLVFFLAALSQAQTDSVYYGERAPRHHEAKQKRESWLKDHLTYGGNFQTLFGTYTYIFLSPTIGFRPFERVHLGIGGIYNYSNWDYGQFGRRSRTVYGAHSFARFNIVPNFFVQAQYDKLLQPDVYNYNQPGKKVWVDYLLTGIGFSQPVGDKVLVNTSLMYNLTQTRLSIYPIPLIFQVGITSRF